MKHLFLTTHLLSYKKYFYRALILSLLLVGGVAFGAFTEPTSPPTGGNPPSPLTTSATKQVKTGSIWARAISTTNPGGKLCLDLGGVKDDDHCVTSWTMSPYENPKCRLESAQVTARSSAVGFLPAAGFGPNFTANLQTTNCDSMLSTQARNDGWIYTGHDNLTRVQSNDTQAPRVCWFSRLVCDGNVTVITGHTSDAPVWYTPATPVANFTISTNQCSDNINNDPVSWNFVSNPSPQPAAYGRSMALSNSMNYVLVSGDGAGYYTYLYKRAGAGSDTYNQLTTGLGRGFNAEPYTRAAAYANNDQFLIVGSWDAATNFLKIYENVSDTFTKIVPNATQGPSVQPPSWVNDVDVFQEGTTVYLAVTHHDGNRISIYKRTTTNPKLFTLLPAALNSYPSSAAAEGIGVAFSTDGTYIAVTTSYVASQPVVTIYRRTGPGADTWNKLLTPNGPNYQPTNQGEGVSFSSDGNYLAVAHHGYDGAGAQDDFFTIYKKNGDAFERLVGSNGLDTDPANYPVNSLSNSWLGVASPSFSPDGNYLALPDYSAASGSSVKVYKRTGDVFEKMANPAYNISNVYSVAFSSDSQRLFVSFANLNGVAQRYIALLNLTGDTFTDHPADPQCTSWSDNNESS